MLKLHVEHFNLLAATMLPILAAGVTHIKLPAVAVSGGHVRPFSHIRPMQCAMRRDKIHRAKDGTTTMRHEKNMKFVAFPLAV